MPPPYLKIPRRFCCSEDWNPACRDWCAGLPKNRPEPPPPGPVQAAPHSFTPGSSGPAGLLPDELPCHGVSPAQGAFPAAPLSPLPGWPFLGDRPHTPTQHAAPHAATSSPRPALVWANVRLPRRTPQPPCLRASAPWALRSDALLRPPASRSRLAAPSAALVRPWPCARPRCSCRKRS